MGADARPDSFGAEASQHHPELERAETASERHPVVHQVGGTTGALGCTQILGGQAERTPEVVGPPAEQHRAVVRGEEPPVGVDDDRVGPLPPHEMDSEFRRRRGGTGVGSVYMQPGSRLLGERSDGRHGIHHSRRGSTDRGHDRDRSDARGAVLGQGCRERVGAKRKRVVGSDVTNPVPAETQRDGGLGDRRVRLLRRIDSSPRSPVKARAGRLGQRGLPCCRERVERADRRGVVDGPPKAPGRPTSWRSQSTTCSSSSVPAGELRHTMALTLSAAASISPRTPEPEPDDGK